MIEAMEAHLRLMARLPIKTHRGEPEQSQRACYKVSPATKMEIRQLKKDGWPSDAIASALGLAVATVWKYGA